MAKTTKKAESKPAKKAASQPLKITLKRVGKNYIGVIDGETLLAVIADEAAVTKLKEKVAAYNLKNSEATKKAIIKMLTPVAAKKAEDKEKLEMKEKGLKKLAKKKEKEEVAVDADRKMAVADIEKAITAEDLTVAEIEALLKKFKKVEEKEKVAAPVQQGYRRPGEH